MKHTKLYALVIAILMIMSLIAAPANAAGGYVYDSAIGGPAAVDKDDAIISAFVAFMGVNGEVIDEDTWTITRPDGTILVFDPDTFIWTRTEPDGSVSTIQAERPPYWYEDGKLIETATGKVIDDIPEYMKPPVKPTETTTPAPVHTPTPVPSTTPAPVENAEPMTYFDDVPEDAWYAKAVNTMAASGLIKGYEDGLFHPENNVTIGELCTIIYRIGKNENVSNKPVSDHPEYTHWASYVVWTMVQSKLGYIYVYPDGADELANRGETINAIMTLIEEAGLIKTGKYTKVHEYAGPEIPDWDVIITNDHVDNSTQHKWKYRPILDAYNYGIINGIDEAGTCNPLGTLTRAELCQMLYNAGLTQYTPVAFEGYADSGG